MLGTVMAAMAATVLVPTGSMVYTDLRSPDARDAGRAASAAQTELRSPDTRDAGRESERRAYTDLRSPDARDAGRVGLAAAAPAASRDRSSGPDAKVVAGSVLALLAIAGGGLAIVSARATKERQTRLVLPSR